MEVYPTLRPHELDHRPEEKKWLIDSLWMEEGVGIIGGEPKCCKSIFALHIAIAVATGGKCFEKYPVKRPGRVLFFAAEDALHMVRSRLEEMSANLNLSLSSLDIHLITVPVMRLDLRKDQERLALTVQELSPRLLILDPFVRLHRIDENSSSEVAPLLARLRELQRVHSLAIMLVHHSKKGGGRRSGQNLRGSGELHAWGDGNLYLRRDHKDALKLSIEQRAAASINDIALELKVTSKGINLVAEADQQKREATTDPIEQILALVENSQTPLSLNKIRGQIKLRSKKVSEILQLLSTAGAIEKISKGYQACSRNSSGNP